MRRGLLTLALLVVSGAVSAEPIAIDNGDFEADLLSDGAIVLGAPSGWLLHQDVGTTLAGHADPAAMAIASEDGDVNNVAWVFQDNGTDGRSFFRQTLDATLAGSTRYTVTLRVADTMAGSVTPPEQGRAFPAIGDGQNTGDVWVELYFEQPMRIDPLPGFTSADLPAPPDGGWTTWTLVWETSANEPSAGLPIGITIGSQGAGVDEEREVFFDDVTLDATPLPEPNPSLHAAALLAVAAWLRTRRQRQASEVPLRGR